MSSREYKHSSSSFETWHSILILAHKWNFDIIAKVAFEGIAALPNVNPLDKIAMCEQYDFNRLVASKAYWAICCRDQPLSYKEGEKIGWIACVLIAAIRDRKGHLTEQNLETKIKEFENYRNLRN